MKTVNGAARNAMRRTMGIMFFVLVALIPALVASDRIKEAERIHESAGWIEFWIAFLIGALTGACIVLMLVMSLSKARRPSSRAKRGSLVIGIGLVVAFSIRGFLPVRGQSDRLWATGGSCVDDRYQHPIGSSPAAGEWVSAQGSASAPPFGNLADRSRDAGRLTSRGWRRRANAAKQ